MNKGSEPHSSEEIYGAPVPDLKSIREAKGISLRDIYTTTRITTVNLEAIEEGRFQLLPEPVYAKTFIKTYARVLEIDSQPILTRYDQYLQSLGTAAETVDGPEKQAAHQAKPGKRNQLVLWACISAVAFAALFYLFLSTEPDTAPVFKAQTVQPPQTETVATPVTAPTPPPDVQKAPAAAVVPPVKDAAPVPNPPATAAPAKSASTAAAVPQAAPQAATPEKPRYRLVIKASEKTWLRVQEDGKRLQERMLNPGDVMERSASEKFVVHIGNAGGVEVLFQDKSLGTLGKTGEVVHLKLP